MLERDVLGNIQTVCLRIRLFDSSVPCYQQLKVLFDILSVKMRTNKQNNGEGI